MKLDRSEWPRVFRQGALLLLGILIVFIGGYALIYQLSWASSPHWIEAHRDRRKIQNLPENFHWFWIHEDSQYWILRLRFDRGPVTLEGLPPDARYWSVTYYVGNEENPSLNMQTVSLNEDGTYTIEFSQDANTAAPNHILVSPDAKRGIIEFRITLQEVGEPALLPTVSQNGVVLVQGSTP